MSLSLFCSASCLLLRPRWSSCTPLDASSIVASRRLLAFLVAAAAAARFAVRPGAAAGITWTSHRRAGRRYHLTGWIRSFEATKGAGRLTYFTVDVSTLPSSSKASSIPPPSGAPYHRQPAPSEKYSSDQAVVHWGATSRSPSWRSSGAPRLRYASSCRKRFVSSQLLPAMISWGDREAVRPFTPALSQASLVRRMSSSKNSTLSSRDMSL
mmetsp:Transcript_13706/g.38958  ORF Transcript_13706/g.38958 Transcript_13706/m.38958 type:complete len:211 (-) Transcript_13706:44-676(-)